MSERFRWGIMGTGSIARQFAKGLGALEDAELAAVGSRKVETAEAFGETFGVARRHGSYEALAADDGLDAIYVATPHPMHKDNSILCLQAGKAVLCEKPFAVNRGEAEAVISVARAEGRFIMEAMWTRFLPTLVQVREWLAAGVIGAPRMVQADFGFRASYDEDSRILDPALAGGGLLDVGVYAVSFAAMVFGCAPERIATLANLGPTGVDEEAGMVLGYPGGGMAVLSAAVRTETPQEARIMGSEGSIHLPAPFWRGSKAVLQRSEGKAETHKLPYKGNGYNREAAEVAARVRAGALESPVMPWAETLSIMETMDRIRAQWGLKYPMEA